MGSPPRQRGPARAGCMHPPARPARPAPMQPLTKVARTCTHSLWPPRLGALCAGVLLSAVKQAPSYAIGFTVYEEAKKWLDL